MKLTYPKPQRDSKLYKMIVEQGFSEFPERKKNYEVFKNTEKETILNYSPVMLDIENISRCNYKCLMCQLSSYNGKRSEDMGLNDFKNIIDSQEGLMEIKIQGLGEPFLQGDTFIEMVKYARLKHLWVRSTTNASLLHMNNNHKKILDADVCELQISIDGASKETYEKIRTGAQYERTVKNCQLINDYGKMIHKNRTRMWVLLQKDNFHELYEFITLAAELGFSKLTYAMIGGWMGQKEWINKNKALDVSFEMNQNTINDLIQSGQNNHVEVTFWGLDGLFTKNHICQWPFYRLFISSDMKIVPCCGIANPEVFNFGDYENYGNIWNGMELQIFRKQHIEHHIQDVCVDCYQFEPNCLSQNQGDELND